MRLFWRGVCAAGLVAVAGAGGQGQVPLGAPPPPGAAVATATAGPGGAATATAAAAPKAGFLKRLCIGLEECKRKLCKTPAGAMLNSMVAPVSGLTGGIIPPFCPLIPSAADLAKPGVSGAAAAAAKEAAEAKERRAAVRFLGTLDCRYYPDAAPALALALRSDPSECVRFEAAMVLNHGCCCNELTVKALQASVSGTAIDGFPEERSVRVRCAAASALEKCLACYVMPADEPVIDRGGGEKPPTPGELPIRPDTIPAPSAKPDQLPPVNPKPAAAGPNRMPSRETIESARRTLNDFNAQLAAYAPAMAAKPALAASGRQSVYHLLKDSAEIPAVNSVPTTNPAPTVTMNPMPGPMPAPTAAPPVASVPATKPTPEAAPAPMLILPMTMNPNPSPTAKPTANLTPPMTMPAAVPVFVPEPTRTPEPPRPTFAPAGLGTTLAPTAPVVASTPMGSTAPTAPPMSAFAPTPMSPMAPAASVAPASRAVAADPVRADAATELGKQVLQAPTVAERHTAIREMVRFDWRQHPVVASVLITSAKADPTPAIRVDCLRHLAAYRMNHPQVMADMAALAADPDEWVRQEAAAALGALRQVP